VSQATSLSPFLRFLTFLKTVRFTENVRLGAAPTIIAD
jgi:hypothetical protein